LYQTILFGFAFQDNVSVLSRSKQTPMQEAKKHRETNKRHVAAKHLMVQAGHAVCNG